ncbi:MAG: DNA repair protein RecN [Actinobacteria bacterium]|nr:DNA repair protein RecN [Actinomycetota bacterium]
MITELRVKDLGVIDELSLQFRPGLTAVTGETGAGKTLVVGAIGLLTGARADNGVVRSGAGEARVDGRFEGDSGTEVVLGRAVPGSGRSRAYVDGAPATVASLGAVAEQLIEMHGQHDHQSLLTPATQREALDTFGTISTDRVQGAKAAVRQLQAELADLGGDVHARAREIDLVRHQLDEIDAADIGSIDEEAELEVEEDLLADATAHREAAWAARQALGGDGGAADHAGSAVAALADRAPLAHLLDRARAVAADLDDLSLEVSRVAESLTDDPERLTQVQARRQLLRELRRKYGDTLQEVIDFASESRSRLAFLEGAAARSAELQGELEIARDELVAALDELSAARREVAGPLAAAVQAALRELAMPRAEFRVEVDGSGGADVAYLLAANPGDEPRPLAKVASGGELSRTMLALRLVLVGAASAPTGARNGEAAAASKTLVFDEVDAGIGGQAAIAVGRALAAVAKTHQVLVVTHLPQVAAFADHQVAVTKVDEGDRATTTAYLVEGADRVVELSRMLSGQPASESARDHAAELLQTAAAERASLSPETRS